jgi:putative oxidoreductase
MEKILWLTRTDDSWVPLVLRLALGGVILPHGLQKAIGAFGGYGFQGTMNYFTETLGIPWIFGLAAILAETAGALALLLGLGTRVSAAVIGITMLTAMLTVHRPNGFFMNWFGDQKGEGVEYFLLALGLALALVLSGGGRYSLDGQL